MKRKITYLTLLLFTALPVMVSCSHGDESEDDNNIFVQYRINVAEPIIGGVIYRDANGNLITEEASVAGLQEWYEYEHVEPPFNAHKQVRFVNNGAEPVPYTLSIFVEGELIKTEEGHVAPQAEEVAQIEYQVPE